MPRNDGSEQAELNESNLFEIQRLKAENDALENERVTLCVLLQEWLRWGLGQPADIIRNTQAAMERNKRPVTDD